MTKLASIPMKMFGPRKLATMSEKVFPVGKKIVILGAGAEGAQCATFLAHRGKEVVLLAETEDVGGLVPPKSQGAPRSVVRGAWRANRL